MTFTEELKHLEIQLEDIKSATNDFNKSNLIGHGGFGNVYKGTLSHYNGRSDVACKRLDRTLGQGNTHFLQEITVLSRYTHENLISLLGFCNEEGEMILVYEHASHGSLDSHLDNPALTWRRRLKICLEAARGLSYLHDPRGSHQRVVHRDIKSGNILLDKNWNAKLSDLGLSKIVPANQEQSPITTNPVGTFGYADPVYVETGLVTKESDVYSFGVLLFEVLCGKLCYKRIDYQNIDLLVPMWKQSYEEEKLNEIIFEDLIRKQTDDASSVKIFSNIAYRCLNISHKERPTMARVVTELQIALESQEISEGKKQLFDFEEMAMTAVPPLSYRSKAELNILLSKGVLLNGGKMWFALNMKGAHCEMISIAECLIQDSSESYVYLSNYNSRFEVGSYLALDGKFKARVRTRFLSPQNIYTVNLVFKHLNQKDPSIKLSEISLTYKLEGEKKCYILHLADWREDGWFMAELFSLFVDNRMVDLEILFDTPKPLVVEGIEFRPMENVKHAVLEDNNMDVSDSSDTDWEQNLPNDYQYIIKRIKDSAPWRTKKELYFVLCKGVIINNGEEWFSITKNGKKCLMISARMALVGNAKPKQKSVPDSRFGEAPVYDTRRLRIVCKIESQLLSGQTTYASYLVYKLQEINVDAPENSTINKAPVKVTDKRLRPDDDDRKEAADFWFIYLVSPQTPVIRRKEDDGQNTHHAPLNRPKIKGLPRQRRDGWMEVQVWEFQTTGETIPMSIKLMTVDGNRINGLIVQGIEFKPIYS